MLYLLNNTLTHHC